MWFSWNKLETATTELRSTPINLRAGIVEPIEYAKPSRAVNEWNLQVERKATIPVVVIAQTRTRMKVVITVQLLVEKQQTTCVLKVKNRTSSSHRDKNDKVLKSNLLAEIACLVCLLSVFASPSRPRLGIVWTWVLSWASGLDLTQNLAAMHGKPCSHHSLDQSNCEVDIEQQLFSRHGSCSKWTKTSDYKWTELANERAKQIWIGLVHHKKLVSLIPEARIFSWEPFLLPESVQSALGCSRVSVAFPLPHRIIYLRFETRFEHKSF